ncbi:MAG: BON domain-containing protein [Betaproteobacteria bacterium]|nr:BON domain-containing protein [Betaproteobacteria bacterium]
MTYVQRWILTSFLALAPALAGCVPVILAGGATAGYMFAEDRRTSGVYVEDQGIEFKTSSRILDRYGDQVHVNATSFNRVVLLTGEVPSEEVKSALADIVKGIENVRSVQNETAVAGASAMSARANDTYTTSKVKSRLVVTKDLSATHIKVVTENNVVYLMGLVTHREADMASEIARGTSGVLKVVRVFEYVD